MILIRVKCCVHLFTKIDFINVATNYTFLYTVFFFISITFKFKKKKK